MRINIYKNHKAFDFKCVEIALSRSHKRKQYDFDSTIINKFQNFTVQMPALYLSLFVNTFLFLFSMKQNSYQAQLLHHPGSLFPNYKRESSLNYSDFI